MYRHPILGVVTEYPVSRLLGLPDIRFCTGLQVEGAARLDNRRLEIWSLYSYEPGKGHLRSFIQDCQTYFDEIVIVRIHNPWLPAVLSRYGFVRLEDDGISMVWRSHDKKNSGRNERQGVI